MVENLVKLSVAAFIAVTACFINRNCNYDILQDKSISRFRYVFSMNTKDVIELLAIIIVSFGFTFLFAFYGYGPLKTIRYCLLLGYLYPVAKADIKHKIVPNLFLIELLVIRIIIFVLEIIFYPSILIDNVIFVVTGAVICGGIMFAVYFLSHHAIGMGDVKLFTIIGMFLGAGNTYIVMFIASLLTALYGGIRVLRKKMKVKDEVAFGPFIALSVFIVTGMGF